MALQKAVIPIALRGLDQKASLLSGVAGSLDELINMLATKGGQGGYEFVPRPGVAAVARTADAGSITSGYKIATLGPSLLLLTGDALYRKAIDRFHRVDDNVPQISLATRAITANSIRATSCDSRYVNGYTISAVIALESGSSTYGVRVSVVDSTGAQVISQQIETGTLSEVRIRSAGNVAVVLWASGTSIRAAKIDTATPDTVTSPINVTTTATSGHYEAQTTPAGAIVVGWVGSGSSEFTQALLDPAAMTVGSPTAYASLVAAAVANFGYLTNDFSSAVLYVAHVGSTGLAVSTFSATTLALVATTVYDAAVTAAMNVAGYRTGATVRVYATIAGATYGYDDKIVVSSGSTVATLILSLSVRSRVLVSGAKHYVLARYTGGDGVGTFFLLDLDEVQAVGKVFSGQILAPATTDARTLADLTTGATSAQWVTASLTSLAIATDADCVVQAYTGASAIQFTAQDRTLGKPIELGGTLHLPGAMPYLYDGNTVTEHGFPIPPEQATATPGSGGNLTAESTYTISIVYAWTDATGALDRSAPSAPQQVVLAAGETKITLSIPTLRLTRKTAVTIEVYATLPDGDGATMFKVSPSSTPLMNDPSSDRVSFVFSLDDEDIEAGEPLYTGGSVLENVSPPPCKAFAVHKGRMLVTGVDGEAGAIWFSKEVIPGFGVVFSDGLISRLTSSVEPITAVASMDQNAVAFTETTTWASSDEYPDDTGVGGVLRFQQYSFQVGASAPGMVARTDQGLIVHAGVKGAWKLSRGLSYDYVGARIEDDVSAMTAATMLAVPGQSQARLIGTVSGVATVLTYEAIFGTWGTWRYSEQATAIVDACVWNGAVAYLTSDGTVLTENTASIDDLGERVAHAVTVSELNLAGVKAFQRIYAGQVTGRVIGTGTFTLQIDQLIDGVAQTQRTHEVDGATEEVLDLEFDPGPNGKCSGYQITVSDADNEAETAFTLVAVTLKVGLKPGLSRIPPDRRMT